MAQTLLTTLRRHRHQPAFRLGCGLLLLAWITFGLVPCTGPTLQHPAANVAVCLLDAASHDHRTAHPEHQPPEPARPECTLKACLEHATDLRAWADRPTNLPTTAPLLAPLIVALLLLPSFRGLRLRSVSGPPTPSIPLIYRFCSLLN